jgi:cyclopropane fatty-acyl-phospholipid synthase-like methyltransferase
MVDQKQLGEFWEKQVPEQYKHYVGSAFDPKVEKCVADMRRHLLDRIDFTGIQTALDWGCGGGLGTSELARKCRVGALDISEKSLQEADHLLASRGQSLTARYKLDDIDDLKITERYDLLFSTSVVQHFPSFAYWQKVAAFWRNMAPRVIAVQTRHGDKVEDHEEVYYKEVRNYILGLRLPTIEVIDSFIDHYRLDHHFLDNDGYSMYEYYIFHRK